MIPKKLFFILEKYHKILFDHEMSPMMKDFLNNLSWSFLGITFNAIMVFIFSIFAGRILGPAGYGKYNLILVIGNLLAILILFGQDSTVIKYVAEEKDFEKKKQYLSNSFYIVVIIGILAFIIGNVVYFVLVKSFDIDEKVGFFALLFAITYGYKNILDSSMRGYHYFKSQALAKIIEGITIVSVLIVIFFMKLYSYEYFLVSIFLGSIAIILFYFSKIKKMIVKWDSVFFKNTLKYSRAAFISAILMISVSSFDRIFIGKFIGVETLGLYSAYLASTTIIVAQFILILSNVLFPMLGATENKKIIIEKIDKIAIISAIPAIFIIYLFSYMTMRLFGKSFHLNYLYLVIFSFIAFIQIICALYRSVIQTVGKAFIIFKNSIFALLIFQIFIYLFLYLFKLIDFKYLLLAYSVINLTTWIATRIIISRLNFNK